MYGIITEWKNQTRSAIHELEKRKKHNHIKGEMSNKRIKLKRIASNLTGKHSMVSRYPFFRTF